jgi:hypothetical protein
VVEGAALLRRTAVGAGAVDQGHCQGAQGASAAAGHHRSQGRGAQAVGTWVALAGMVPYLHKHNSVGIK